MDTGVAVHRAAQLVLAGLQENVGISLRVKGIDRLVPDAFVRAQRMLLPTPQQLVRAYRISVHLNAEFKP